MIELVRGNVMVELVDLGEGWSGDYDPDDPSDEALLRFDVMRRPLDGAEYIEWEAVEDASYCTQIPADTDERLLERVLEIIMDEVHDEVEAGVSVKKKCEGLSWISPADLIT